MTGHYNAMHGEIIAAIAFVLERVAKKYAAGGAWREFVVGGGVKVWVAKAPKDAKMIVRRVNAV